MHLKLISAVIALTLCLGFGAAYAYNSCTDNSVVYSGFNIKAAYKNYVLLAEGSSDDLFDWDPDYYKVTLFDQRDNTEETVFENVEELLLLQVYSGGFVIVNMPFSEDVMNPTLRLFDPDKPNSEMKLVKLPYVGGYGS